MTGNVAGWAGWYQRMGWAPFAVAGVNADGTCRCYRGASCEVPGKHPLHKGWTTKATRTEFELGLAFPDDVNVGIVTGAPSGVFTVDVDAADGKPGEDSARRLVEDGVVELPPTLTLLTGSGSGSRQLVYRIPEGEARRILTRPNAFGAEYPGVDVKGDGGFFVAPPSLHRSGGRYAWADLSVKAAVAPQALVDAASRPRAKASGTDFVGVAESLVRRGLGEGERNRGVFDLLSPVANSWGEPEPGPELIFALSAYAHWLNEKVCRPPMDREEVNTIVGSVVERSKASRGAMDKYAAAMVARMQEGKE